MRTRDLIIGSIQVVILAASLLYGTLTQDKRGTILVWGLLFVGTAIWMSVEPDKEYVLPLFGWKLQLTQRVGRWIVLATGIAFLAWVVRAGMP